jgi:predicted hydrolase (HD superfamily)
VPEESTYPDLNGKDRAQALDLLTEWVTSRSLLRHCLSVETAMRAYARRFGEPEEPWGLVGLLHDFDFERHPTLDEHPFVGASYLEEHGWPAWFAHAIRTHANVPEYPRGTSLERALFAVDELTGFISAVALVRPSKAVADVSASSVKKKMKDRKFAEAIHRDELLAGAEELGIPFEEHVAFVVDAMAGNAEALGLAGVVNATSA